MIHVRRYVAADLVRVLPMARAFHAESPVHRGKTFNPDKVAELLAGVRSAPDWLALIVEDDEGELVGFALVTVQAPYYSDDLELLDLAVYVAPTRRGASGFFKMMGEIEAWARAQDAVESSIGINTGINHDAALRSFVKLGYLPSGIQVSKRL